MLPQEIKGFREENTRCKIGRVFVTPLSRQEFNEDNLTSPKSDRGLLCIWNYTESSPEERVRSNGGKGRKCFVGEEDRTQGGQVKSTAVPGSTKET